MGIERKKLSMSEKDRLNTAIHESGHAITGYFNKNAMDLYKATIVARGGALGVVSILDHFHEIVLRLSLCPMNRMRLQAIKHRCLPR